MKVFTIIVTFNGAQWIRKCLGSIKSSTVRAHSVVIDNCSTDNTLEIIKTEFPETTLIESSENLGFGRANNIGINRALDDGAEYVFLLNQDAWVEVKTIESLIEVSEEYPKYGIISPLHLNGKGDKLDWHFSNYIVPKRCPELYSDALLKRPMKALYEGEYVNAAAWLIPRKVLEKVGGFDPIFFVYGEDDNFMQRVIFHGFKIGVCPFAKIYHDREDRLNKRVFNRDLRERNAIIKYGNVNLESPELLDHKIKALKINYLLRSITLRKSARRYKEEIEILETIKSKVIASWKKNRIPGMNHL